MKNEKIINSLNKITSSDETKEQIFNDILQKNNDNKRHTFKPAKIAAMAAAVVLIVGLFNITTVVAFIRGLFFVPGVGMTDNDISVSMLNEPIEIGCDLGEVTLEFATKIKHEGGKCEILLYFASKDENLLSILERGNDDTGSYSRPEFNAVTIINDETHIFDFHTGGGGNPYGVGYMEYIIMANNDFPDINEFNLQFRDTTAHIILTELSEEEKIPYASKEINGIKLLAYKFRNNNRLISLDVMNSNDLGDFYTGTPNIFFNTVTGEQDSEIKVIGDSNYSFIGWSSNKGYGFGYYIKELDNKLNVELTGIKNTDLPGIVIDYYATIVRGEGDLTTDTTSPQLKLPIPKDGETIKIDIKIPVGGTFYEVTEVKREGDVIYYKDNNIEKNMPPDFDMDSAARNSEVYVGSMTPFLSYNQAEIIKINTDDNSITGFNPDDSFVDINIQSIKIIYFGDFSVDLTQKQINN